jgi:hypothetical protein
MPTISTRLYNVYVQDAVKTAHAIAIAVATDLGSRHRAIEFRLGDSTFQGSELAITSSRRATFREQFRLIRRAYDAFEGNCEGDRAFIESKMHEAFGDNVAVEVSRVTPATLLVREKLPVEPSSRAASSTTR